MVDGPSVGPESADYRGTCDYSRRPGDPLCGEPATVHVLAADDVYGVVGLGSCDRHAMIARLAGIMQAEHTYEGYCGFPSTIWHLSLNRCVLDDSGEEPAARAEAMIHA